MQGREGAPQGDAVEGRGTAAAEDVLGETGALPEERGERGAGQGAEARAAAAAEPTAAGGATSPDPAAAGATPPDPAAVELAALRQELEAERRRAAEHLQARARLQADFDNYRKRMLSEQARWREDAVADALRQLLPVFDNLERATRAAGDAESLKKGVDLTLRQLRDVLGGLGLQEIEVGEHSPFDPNRHEAMIQVESAEHADGEVVRVERRGYTFRGALLRPALVAVAKAAAGREQQT